MKIHYKVTYKKQGKDTYSSSIVYAYNASDILKYYRDKAEEINITSCSIDEVSAAKKKKIPIIEL